MSSYRIHTAIASAQAVLNVGEILVSKRWNETTKQKAQERAICVPFNCLKAPEVSESFRALVEAVLASQAQEILKRFCDENPNSFEVPSELFDRSNLTETFLNSGTNWLSKQELEISFNSSATWKRISSRPEFVSNSTYKAAANSFRETILKLSGKAVSIPAEKCDLILSKISDDDLETSFGSFVVSRLNQIRSKSSEAIDFDAL